MTIKITKTAGFGKLIACVGMLIALATCADTIDPKFDPESLETIYDDENVSISAGPIWIENTEENFPNKAFINNVPVYQMSSQEIVVPSYTLISFPTSGRNEYRISSKDEVLSWQVKKMRDLHSWANDRSQEELQVYNMLLEKCENGDPLKQTDLYEFVEEYVSYDRDPYAPDIVPYITETHDGRLALYTNDGGVIVRPITCEQHVIKNMERFIMRINGQGYLFTTFANNDFVYGNKHIVYNNFARRVE